MTDYTISADKLQELNVLINEGGQIPTEVNQYTGQTAAFLGVNNTTAAKQSNSQASVANDKSGAAWSNIQKWHDSVKASAPPVEPPIVPPVGGGGSPVDPIPNDSVTRNFGPLYANTKQTTHAGGPGNFSFSVSGGSAWFQAWINGVLAIDGGMTPVPVKNGDLIEFQITTPANGGNCTYSINK